jgi:hypothetical protein
MSYAQPKGRISPMLQLAIVAHMAFIMMPIFVPYYMARCLGILMHLCSAPQDPDVEPP